jgi:hypothetical protein
VQSMFEAYGLLSPERCVSIPPGRKDFAHKTAAQCFQLVSYS